MLRKEDIPQLSKYEIDEMQVKELHFVLVKCDAGLIKEVALEADISAPYVSMILSGKRKSKRYLNTVLDTARKVLSEYINNIKLKNKKQAELTA